MMTLSTVTHGVACPYWGGGGGCACPGNCPTECYRVDMTWGQYQVCMLWGCYCTGVCSLFLIFFQSF